MDIKFNVYLYEAYIADLYSDDAFLREMAISQLQSFVEIPKVCAELEKATERETNPYLKHQIQILLDVARLECGQGENEADSFAENMSEDALMGKWLGQKIQNVKNLFMHINNFAEPLRAKILIKIIEQEKELFRLIPAFSSSDELMNDPEVIKALADKLQARDNVFLVRLISFLAARAPGYLLQQIQALLKHHNFFIRFKAIQVLYRFAKPQALRLLEELILANEQTKRSASSFLCLFPFEDVQNIVLSLIDYGALQDEFLEKLIKHLVYNNPDLEFFKRLTVVEVLRGEEVPQIANLRLSAAEALKIAGIISLDKEAFCQNTLKQTIEFIQKKSGIAINPGLDPERDQEATSWEHTVRRKDSILADKEYSGDEKKLEEVLGAKNLSNDNKSFIRELVLSGKAETFKALFLKVILKFQPKDSQVIKWLEESIGRSKSEDLLIIMKVLGEINPARLIPHLPVLCHNDNDRVAFQAIRLYRKHQFRGLLRQIEVWLGEDNERTWKAALSAMLQIKIEDARNILLNAFQTTQRISLIKYFAPIFQISPDHISLYKLERIFESSKGKKRDILFDQIQLLRDALGLTSQRNIESEAIGALAESGFHEKWEEFREKLDKIRYVSEPELLKRDLNKLLEKHWLKLLGFTLLVIAILFWPEEKLISEKGLSGKSLQKTFQIKSEAPKLKKGDIKIFILGQYDPINRLWRAETLSGEAVRLRLRNPADFSTGFKGNFKISWVRISSLGNAVLTCELKQ